MLDFYCLDETEFEFEGRNNKSTGSIIAHIELSFEINQVNI